MDDLSPMEALKKRHRDEQRALQAQVQALKKTSNKNDKKRKKECQEQILTLEKNLVEKHKQEILELENVEAKKIEEPQFSTDNVQDVDLRGLITSESELSGFPLDSTVGDLILSDPATPTASFTAPSLATPSDSTLTPSSLEPEFGSISDLGGKKSKAHRRREQKEMKEKEREQRIIDEEETNKKGARHIEAEKLRRILALKNQAIHEVPANGHCLYSAVADQLKRRKEKRETIEDLRDRAASHIRSHKDEFLPFLSDPNTSNPVSEEAFEEYCNKVAKTTSWGGQLEIRALANEFKIPIEVVQADGPVINVGGEEFGNESPLILSYHRHFYRLGEHYNSVIDKVGDSEAEEESLGSLSI